jgi:photosystem II stability/assembly factor-like uncharacterized protein
VSLPLNVSMHALSFLPTDDRVVFATTTGGLFRSADRGATWRRVDGGVPHSDLTGLAIGPDSGTLYVSDFTWGGIFRSTDGGASWARMPTDGLGSDRMGDDHRSRGAGTAARGLVSGRTSTCRRRAEPLTRR